MFFLYYLNCVWVLKEGGLDPDLHRLHTWKVLHWCGTQKCSKCQWSRVKRANGYVTDTKEIVTVREWACSSPSQASIPDEETIDMVCRRLSAFVPLQCNQSVANQTSRIQLPLGLWPWETPLKQAAYLMNELLQFAEALNAAGQKQKNVWGHEDDVSLICLPLFPCKHSLTRN